MSTFPKCPNCGNDDDGDSIWTCRDCGLVHCRECDPPDGTCPSCGGDCKSSGTIDSSSASDDDEDGSGYSSCPNCGKNDNGDSIWKCGDCGHIHCQDCDPDDGGCPSCGSNDVRIVGRIDN